MQAEEILADYKIRKLGLGDLTVDAYSQAIPFYLKNDFVFLSSGDEDQRTRLMYFDLGDIVTD